jgi:hypothetical protein
MESSLFWDVTQRMLLLIYRRAWPLKMEPIGCPETSVNIHQHMLRKMLEARRSHVSGIFKSRALWLSLGPRTVWCETARPSFFSGRRGGGSLPELSSLPLLAAYNLALLLPKQLWLPCRFEKGCATIFPTDSEAARLWLIYVHFWRQKSAQRSRCSD